MKTIPKAALGAIPSITIEPAGSKGTKHTCTLMGHVLDTRTSLHRHYDACVVLIGNVDARIDYYKKELADTVKAAKKGDWWVNSCTTNLADYEKLKADGLVPVSVPTWCGNRVLAGKQLSRWQGDRLYAAVIIAERI
jgi:hypothetical protein